MVIRRCITISDGVKEIIFIASITKHDRLRNTAARYFSPNTTGVFMNKKLTAIAAVTDVSQTLTSTRDTRATTLGDSGSSKISIPESSDAPISLPTIDGDSHLTIPSAENADYEAISTGNVVISGEDEATSLLIQDSPLPSFNPKWMEFALFPRWNPPWISWFKSHPRPSKKAVLNKRTAALRQYPPKC